MAESSEVITVRYKSYFKVNNDSPEKINLDDIEVDINTNSTPNGNSNQTQEKPNSLALTVLWAYFSACQQGLLTKNKTLPWEEIESRTKKDDFDFQQWFSFLDNIINENWIDWIKDPQELKERTLEAYNELNNSDTFYQEKIAKQNKEHIEKLKAKIKADIKEKLSELDVI